MVRFEFILGAFRKFAPVKTPSDANFNTLIGRPKAFACERFAPFGCKI